ncbi:MAG: hypothetical protein QXS02_04815 [Candidatus Thermoplasmatota archaeon]
MGIWFYCERCGYRYYQTSIGILDSIRKKKCPKCGYIMNKKKSVY